MKKLLLLATIISFGITNGQNLFQDNFNSYTSGIDLSGQGTWTNNSSLPGGAGTASASGPGATKVVDIGMSYLDYGISTKSRDIKINSDGCGTAFTAVNSGDTYFGMVLNLTAVQANNNSDFFRVMSGDNYNTSFRLYAVSSGGGISFGIAKGANGNAITFTSVAYNLNTDHLLIFRYTQGSGTSDDVVNLYVDPVYIDGVPASPTITTNTGADQVNPVGLDRLSFRHNWTNGMPTGGAGLVSIARTWPELTFQPLATNQFSRETFSISSNQVVNGILNIKSNITLEKAALKIYNVQGSLMETKSISLEETINDIAINPIRSAGVYIVEITTENNQRFTQKILVN